MSVLQLIKRVGWALYPIYSTPMAFLVYHYLLKKKKTNELLLLMQPLLGDQLYALSCIDLIKKEYPEYQILVIGSDNNWSVINTFNGVDRWVLFPKNSFKYICIQCLIRNAKYSVKAIENNIINTVPVHYKCFKKEDGSVRHILCKNLFKLKNIYPITYHSLKIGCVNAIQSFYDNKDKIVVINPYSNTMSFTKEIYEEICSILKNAGYIVYTNVVNNQKPILGSFELRCSLEELFSIASQIPLFVTVRSGVADFLVPSKVNMYVIYEISGGLSQWISEFYTLSEWKPQGHIREIIATGVGVDYVCDSFIDYLSEIN